MVSFPTPHVLLCASLMAALGACASDTRAPTIVSVEPGEVAQGQPTSATILGHHFYAFASVALDGEQASEIDDQWQVMVAGPNQSMSGIEVVNDSRIQFVVPAGLPLGFHDLTIVGPSGETDTLVDGLRVLDETTLRLAMEDMPSGDGKTIDSPKVALGSTLALYAVGRSSQDGSFVNDANASWQISGTAGSISPGPNTATKFVANALGSAIVMAEHALYGQTTSGTITVVECVEDLDCVDTCRSANTCQSDACVEGPMDELCKGGTELVFQNGVNGYEGSVDTFIDVGTPNLYFGKAESVSWQGIEASIESAALLRFDEIFGTRSGQIPPGSTIVQAVLQTQALGGSLLESGRAYEVGIPWLESATWNNFGADPGYQAGDLGALVGPAPSSSFICPCPPHDLDVTATIESISKGANNYGWIFIPTSNTLEIIASNQAPTIADRPRLKVSFVPPTP